MTYQLEPKIKGRNVRVIHKVNLIVYLRTTYYFITISLPVKFYYEAEIALNVVKITYFIRSLLLIGLGLVKADL